MTYHYKATFCSTIYTCQYVQSSKETSSQKRDVCLYEEQHPKATQAQILVHFSNEWGVSVGRSTISDILRDKVKWLSVSKECGPREWHPWESRFW